MRWRVRQRQHNTVRKGEEVKIDGKWGIVRESQVKMRKRQGGKELGEYYQPWLSAYFKPIH